MIKPISKSNFEIIIPIGNITIGNTKTRLSSNLNELQRKNLTIWLLNHVVTNAYFALNKLKMKPNITILGNKYSGSEFDYITHIYSKRNQIHIKELGGDLNDSLQQYIDVSHSDNKLILPADLGMIEISDILTFVQKSNDFNTPVIAKAIKDNGTNGLLLPLKKDFIFRFGKNSFDYHIKTLCKYEEVNSTGVNYDIDDNSDLVRLIQNNNRIQNVLDIEGKIVIPINQYGHTGNGINVNCKCHTFSIPNNIELRDSKDIIYFNNSIDIIIN